MTKARLEAFSDGVLAILITIMVLELKTPESTHWEHIRELLPELGSYLISFVYLGIYWGNHHHLIHTVRRVNAKIIWSNMHLLFWLSLVPFATGWMGKSNFEQTTVVVYGVLLIVCGASFNLLNIAIRSDYDCETPLSVALGKQNYKGYISLLLYALAVGMAFIRPWISYLLFVAVAVMWIVPDKNLERTLSEE